MRTFKVSDIEEERLETFETIHMKCYRPTTIGGQFSYTFTPTSIGIGICIECNSCGEKENVTNW